MSIKLNVVYLKFELILVFITYTANGLSQPDFKFLPQLEIFLYLLP
jgi:hypothetical protein